MAVSVAVVVVRLSGSVTWWAGRGAGELLTKGCKGGLLSRAAPAHWKPIKCFRIDAQ